MGRIERVATAATVQGFMDQASLTPLQAHELLAEKGRGWWRAWDVQALRQTCAGVPDEALAEWPDVARWRALLAVMTEGADALACLERAYAGHRSRGDEAAAGVDAHVALVLCVIDMGLIGQMNDWLGRAAEPMGAGMKAAPQDTLWLQAGAVARAIFGGEPGPVADAATDWLAAQLRPLQAALAPDERLIAALALVNLAIVRGQFERIDAIAISVEEPTHFSAASALMRARWLHLHGVVHYQIGNLERAESAWRRSDELAAAHALTHLRAMNALVLLRLLIDRGRLDEAAAIEASIQPQWGAGRELQLLLFKQMGARLQLARGQPARALAILQEVLALARQHGLSDNDCAGFDLDLAQLLLANGRLAEAEAWLQQRRRIHVDRDAEVFGCLHDLLRALNIEQGNATARRALLASGLASAQRVRYTTFLRLLPTLAAKACALALRDDVEPVFVAEVIRSRDLPAPDDADERWPWALHLRLFGGFAARLHGRALMQDHKGKVAKKPLELLRLLACSPGLRLGMAAAGDALWPDAAGDDAAKNLETTVQRLRRLLGDDAHRLVVVSEGRVGLDTRFVSSDVAHRRTLIQQLDRLSLASAPTCQVIALVARIVDCGNGALLPGADDASWLQAHREQCRREIERARRLVAAALASAPEVERAAADAALAATVPR